MGTDPPALYLAELKRLMGEREKIDAEIANRLGKLEELLEKEGSPGP